MSDVGIFSIRSIGFVFSEKRDFLISLNYYNNLYDCGAIAAIMIA
jgi:hypothetical protein